MMGFLDPGSSEAVRNNFSVTFLRLVLVGPWHMAHQHPGIDGKFWTSPYLVVNDIEI